MLSNEAIRGMVNARVPWFKWIGRVRGRKTVAYNRSRIKFPFRPDLEFPMIVEEVK